jgi:phosphopantetheinyl transferase
VSVADSREALRRSAEAVLRAELGATNLARLCPRCGSGAHGRPHLTVARGRAPSVSLSYADGLVLVAWTWDGPIGVDVEPEGPAVGEFGTRREWTRAEAVLKATGEGLSQDPGELPPMWSMPLDLGPTWVATVAVAGVAEADVSWRTAGPAAPRA